MTAEPEGAKGIDVHKAMDWLFAALGGRIDGPPPGPQSSDPLFFGGGTGNMKGLYACCWYIYALLGKTVLAGSLGVARKRLLNFLRMLPHGLAEPTTASHGQLWCALISMAIWAAWKAGDKEVLDTAIAWKAAEYALWKPCRVVGVTVNHWADSRKSWASVLSYWMPGSRARDAKGFLGSNFARTTEGEIIRDWGVMVPTNKSYVGPLALLACSKEIMERIQQPPKVMPILFRPFHVRRWKDDFIAWYDAGLPSMGPNDAPAHAAGVLNGARWIEGPGGEEIMQKHFSRYPTTEPDLVLDVETILKGEIDV